MVYDCLAVFIQPYIQWLIPVADSPVADSTAVVNMYKYMKKYIYNTFRMICNIRSSVILAFYS